MAAQFRQARILGINRRCSIGFSAGNAGWKLRQELWSPGNTFDERAPKDGKCRDMIGVEYLHLVVSDHDGRLRLEFLEGISKLSNRPLASRVPILKDIRSHLFAQPLVLSECCQRLKGVARAPEEMLRVGLIRRNSLSPCVPGHRQHGSVGCADSENNARHSFAG